MYCNDCEYLVSVSDADQGNCSYCNKLDYIRWLNKYYVFVHPNGPKFIAPNWCPIRPSRKTRYQQINNND